MYVTDFIFRNMLETILQLQKNLVYLPTHPHDITQTLDQCVQMINVKEVKKYIAYQADYRDRAAILRMEKRETPAVEGADQNMPPILHTWKGNQSASQPTKNYDTKASCAFNKTRILSYEKRNKDFDKIIKLSAKEAAPRVSELMIDDIAYIKSFDVVWISDPTALETTHSNQSDDDEDEPDTTKWCLTDATTVPFKHLGIPRKGKLPPHLLVAAAIFNVAKPAPLGADTFCRDLAERMNELRNEHDSSDLDIIMTRKFTAEEAAIYSTGIMPTPESESDEDEPTAAAPASAASSPAKGSKPSIAAAGKSSPAKSQQVSRASRADGAGAGAGAGAGVGAEGESLDKSVAAGGEAAKAPPPAPAHRGRIKAKASYREVPPQRPGRKREEPDRYTPPAPPETPPSVRVVVKKRKSEADTTPSATSPSEESTPFAIPVSAQSSRVMPGELHINKRFSKTYMSIHPLRPAPLDDMTVSSLWHAVSLYHCVT